MNKISRVRTGYLIIILISFLCIVAYSIEVTDEEEGKNSQSNDKEDELPPLHGPRKKDIHDWTVEM